MIVEKQAKQTVLTEQQMGRPPEVERIQDRKRIKRSHKSKYEAHQ